MNKSNKELLDDYLQEASDKTGVSKEHLRAIMDTESPQNPFQAIKRVFASFQESVKRVFKRDMLAAHGFPDEDGDKHTPIFKYEIVPGTYVRFEPTGVSGKRVICLGRTKRGFVFIVTKKADPFKNERPIDWGKVLNS